MEPIRPSPWCPPPAITQDLVAATTAASADQHKLTVTLTTPAWIDNDEYYLLKLAFVAAATSTIDLLGAVANFTERDHHDRPHFPARRRHPAAGDHLRPGRVRQVLRAAGKTLTAISALLGLLFGIAYQISLSGFPAGFAGWFTVIVFGLALGLVASGFYDFANSRFPKINP